ncbi:hypothetical protein J7E93_13460 [Streptomyces sp. ISL-36]|nr:hypothetical protein [Streptomyces sp. ISL-36]
MAVVAGLFLSGAGAAAADGWQKIENFWTPGVHFTGVEYKWEPKGQNHGGYHFRGDLKDLEPNDGHNVYVEVKVEGYDWNRFKGVQKRTVHLDKVVWDGAAQYTSRAQIQVCRDRGTLRPDNCTAVRKYKRPNH